MPAAVAIRSGKSAPSRQRARPRAAERVPSVPIPNRRRRVVVGCLPVLGSLSASGRG
ncbi:MAG: hypothetical protein QOJ59_658 [Thermomicrobiales bacterium]|nr:hypothetical protein [Thermomicrobiales bacterium]